MPLPLLLLIWSLDIELSFTGSSSTVSERPAGATKMGPKVMLRLGRKKKVLFSVVTLLALCLILEIGARAYFAFKVGPSVLLYGTSFARRQIQPASESYIRHPKTKPEAKNYRSRMSKNEWRKRRTVITHSNELSGYSKYFPNQERIDFDIETREGFDVMINSRGFRGREFTDRKKPGVIRIVTLGASSTFGYFNRDEETYPVYLEQILNDRYSGELHFEVINMGIPHLTAENIYALFLAEGIQLNPDIVTFCEGNNDAARPLRRDIGFFASCFSRAGRYSILVGLINSILDVPSRSQYSPDEFQQHASAISNRFIDIISRIHQECKERGILFVVANQQKNSQTMDRGKLKGLSYEEEVRRIRAKGLESEQIKSTGLKLLTHAVLMRDLATWAKANRVPFVDVIARLDQDRDVMISWVHLSRRGNRMVAEAFADEILRHSWNPRPAMLLE